MSLQKRVGLTNASGADAFLSIHHDSAQPHLLQTWQYDGKARFRTDTIKGFSIFVSRDNGQFARSQALAETIAREWLKTGHPRTLHHAEPIKGENRELLNRALGVYEAPFAVIKRTVIPSVLLEIGVLVNPAEETWLNETANRARLQTALIRALRAAICDNRAAASPVQP